MCNEVDNISGMLAKTFYSVPELDIDETLLMHKFYLCRNKGRIKHGQGDESIDNKIPHMLNELGMKDIDVRTNDRVWHIEPPYISEGQQFRLKLFSQNIFSEASDDSKSINLMKGEFLAGGGTEEEFGVIRQVMAKHQDRLRRRVDEKKLAYCGGGFFYIIKARKPKK